MLVLAFYMLWEQGKKQQEYMEENRPRETDFVDRSEDLNSTPSSFELGSSKITGSVDSNRTELTSLPFTTDSFKD